MKQLILELEADQTQRYIDHHRPDLLFTSYRHHVGCSIARTKEAVDLGIDGYGIDLHGMFCCEGKVTRFESHRYRV